MAKEPLDMNYDFEAVARDLARRIAEVNAIVEKGYRHGHFVTFQLLPKRDKSGYYSQRLRLQEFVATPPEEE